MNKMIVGAGGGGGGKGGGGGGDARTPVEAADSLRSKAYAKVLDLVCEGEIEGLVDGLKSVYLDGTPVQNASGSYNFSGVKLSTRNGTQSQTYLTGFSAVENELSVSVEVKNSASVVRTVTNSSVNAVRVTMSFPVLTKQETNGDINGTSLSYKIQVQSNGGGYVDATSEIVVTGKTTSRYERSHKIQLSGSAPWDIRVVRLTADSTSATLQNKSFWSSYTEIIDAKLRYPNSAIVGVRVDSSQFQSIPTRGYDMKLLRVQVPTNYDPDTKVYTGSWDGTFKIAWTDNPAWCFYDLVTNNRYGLGDMVDAAQVDKWAMYQIGRYCDELVPDGFGGFEPRFTCNLYMQTRAEAYKVLMDFSSIFRGMVYWSTGAITAVQDAPSDPVSLYTEANIIDGKFIYAGSSINARHTVALVTWNDPADMYRQKVEYVEDTQGIARYGIQQTEITAIGCTSRGQATRVGRWLLYSERFETETVQFQIGLDGALVRPGQIIKVADRNRAAARLGGRVSSSTTGSITVDRTPTVSVTGWTIYATLPDGTIESRTISGISGAVVSVASDFTAAPTPQGVWVISGTAVEAQTFRVIGVSEDTDTSTKYSVLAIKHEPLKYEAIEDGLVLQPRDITLLSAKPEPPLNGFITEYLYNALTDVKTMALISWDPSPSMLVTSYDVTYRVDDGNYTTATTSGTSLQLTDAKEGTYTIQVYAVNSIGSRSVPYTFVASVLGKTARPADITGLQMTVQSDTGILQWDTHADLDVRIGGQISVRYSEELEGAQWNTSLPIGDFPGSATSASVPLRAGTYLAKAKDSTGQMSQNAALIVTDAPNILQFNAVASSTQDPTFVGAKTDLVVLNDRLVLDQTEYMDDIEDWDEFENLEGGLVASGEYEFDTYIDTGAVYTSRVSATFSVLSYNIANMVDEWPLIDSLGLVDEGALVTDFVDTWTDWDAIVNFDLPNTTDDSSLQVFISTTNDDPAGSPTWSGWRVFYVGDYTARAFKFKVKLIRGEDDNNQVALATLGVVVDVPDRVESANNVSVPSDGLAVTFANAFFNVPATAITAENMSTGDYAQITAKTSAGFTIQFKNSAGTGVARTMDWIAKGYGYRN